MAQPSPQQSPGSGFSGGTGRAGSAREGWSGPVIESSVVPGREGYTCADFQPPRENNHRVNRPTADSDTNTAQNTPDEPQSSRSASHQASGIWISQKNTRLIFVGVAVSPAPLNACTERSEEHTSELQSLMRISYDVFCL